MNSQEFAKCNRIVVCFIVRAVEQCYRSFTLGLGNGPPPIAISFEFREILESEFIPLCRIVSEPLSQFCAGSQVLKEELCIQRILPDPFWPQSVNEKSPAAFSVDRAIWHFILIIICAPFVANRSQMSL